MHLKEGMRGYLVDLSICIPLKGEMDAGLAALKDTTDPVLLSHFLSLRLHFLLQIVLFPCPSWSFSSSKFVDKNCKTNN